MTRILPIAVALLLVPGIAFAQRGLTNIPNKTSAPPAATDAKRAPPPAASRPSHHRPHHRPPTAGNPPRPPMAGNPSFGRPHHRPNYAYPQRARGDRYFHRGNWFARLVAGAFIYPPGWHYREWGIGARLPPVLYASNYYYGGYGPLGLEAPPPGYSWVRYGPDLLLVNLHTGEVEDAVYGVFE